MAELTARMDRRQLLLACLALALVGNAASAFAPGFGALLALRAAVVVSAAVFTPQAASAVSLLVPGAGRAGAVAAVFLGWSAAMAAGLPAVSLIAEHGGWREAYGALAIVAAAAWLAVRVTLPAGLHIAPLGRAAWAHAAGSRAIRATLAVTALSLAGQFVLFPFLAVQLRAVAGLPPEQAALCFVAYGLAGLAGNIAAARAAARFGLRRAIAVSLALIVAGLAAASAFPLGLSAALVALIVWGLGFASTNSLQQARLIALGPALAPVTVALNSSLLYVGQAAGAALGAALLAGPPAALPLAGAALAALAWTLSQRITDPSEESR